MNVAFDKELVEEKPPVAPWRRYVNGLIAAEISRLSRYADQVIQLLPRHEDGGVLLDQIDAPVKRCCDTIEQLSSLRDRRDDRSVLLLNGSFNHEYDIEEKLHRLHARMSRGSRLVVVAYNPYLRWLYTWANRVGIRQGEMPTTFLTETDLLNLARLSGFEVVRYRPVAFSPAPLAGVGTFLNRLLPSVPLIRHLSFATVLVLRPVIAEATRPSLSVIIPARNERGNIAAAVERFPVGAFGTTEILFVEGNSTDGTAEEIDRVCRSYSGPLTLAAYRQTGRGKADAVRLGMSKAQGDLVTILDADLTMPPELLPRFYDAYCRGKADFINGSRLVYPMEGEAMKFLNSLGNVFFAKALSFVMGTRLGDSLCGTKLFARRDYERFIAWRRDFGDFDPFGDFEILFPAASLGLGVIDVPIRYRARTYGTTNIRRFRDGLLLLRMTLIGWWRLACGAPVR